MWIATVTSCLVLAVCGGEEPAVRLAPVQVVDVENDQVLPGRAIILQNGRIVAVTDAAAPSPEGVGTIDGANLYAVPGLIDSHVHLNDPEREVRLCVAYGVVFVRDMGGGTQDRIALRERARAGELLGVDMVVTGTLIDGDPPYHSWTEAVCTTPEEGREAVRDLAASGVDQLKVYARLRPEVYEAILAEARRIGLRVVGHVPDSRTLWQAAESGQASNEHLTRIETLLEASAPDSRPTARGGFAFMGGWFDVYDTIDPETLEANLLDLADSGMVQCPTLVLNASYARVPPDDDTLAVWNRFCAPDDVRAWTSHPAQWESYIREAAEAWPRLLDLVGRMHRAGNVLLVGTDLANPYAVAGFSVHAEMEYLTQAGLSNAEALEAATLAPAKFLGVQDRLGSIEPGKDASFFLMRESPLLDLRAARDIEAVWVRGRRFDADALEQLEVAAEQAMRARVPGDEPDSFAAPTGDRVATGRMVCRYDAWDDGVEDFAVVRSTSGRMARSLNRQRGFGRTPMLVETEHDEFGVLVSLTWSTFALAPTHGRMITSADGTRLVTTSCAGVERQQRFSDSETLLVPPAGMASEALMIRSLDLAPNEARTVSIVQLDATGRDGVPVEWIVTRRAHDPSDAADPPRSAEVYQMQRKNNDLLRRTLWLDEEGILLRLEQVQGSSNRSATLFDPS